MIISIRGTNGSGKTTVVRALIDSATSSRPVFGLLGVRNPEAYALQIEGVAETVYVLGPYTTTAACGFDGVTNYEHQPELIRKYVERGHVVYEGLISSKVWGRIGVLLEEVAPEVGVMLVYLTTSMEECIRRVEQRRADRGETITFNPRNLEAVYRQVILNRRNVLEGNHHGINVEDCSSSGAAEVILTMLENE